jgi:hypothetical protein
MALTVKETKAGSRPGSGYSTTYPTKGSHPLDNQRGRVFSRAVLKPGKRVTGQLVGKQGYEPDRKLALTPRTIT